MMTHAMQRLMIVVFLLATCASAIAQDARLTVTADVFADRVYLGDSTLLRIVVSGATSPQRPEPPPMDGLLCEYYDESTSQNVVIVNGRRSEQIERTYRFRITPLREGTHRIPGFTVRAGSEERTTGAIWISAEPPPPNADYALRITEPGRPVYVGEPVILTLTWYLGGQFRGPTFTMLEPIHGYELRPAPDPRQSLPNVDPKQFAEFSFLGQSTVGMWGVGTLEGRTFTTFEFSCVVVPTHVGGPAGRLQFGPVHLAFDRPVQTPRDVFDRGIFERERAQRVVIASNAVRLDVRSLPTEGRPPKFTGLVGEYALAASASPTDVRVGDPITLTLRVTGPDSLADAAAPRESWLSAFHPNFKLSSDGWRADPGAQPRQRTYSTIIRAQHQDVSSIPPIELAYFDTAVGEYRIARTNEIPLRVASTRRVTAADAVRLEEAVTSREQRRDLTPGPGGLMANAYGPSVLADRSAWLRRSPWWGVAVSAIVPPLAVGCVVIVARRHGPSRRALIHRAIRRAETRVRKANGDANVIAGALQSAVGVALDIEPDSVTAHDARGLAARVPRDIAEGLARIIENAGSRTYGGRDEIRVNQAEAISLLRDLARHNWGEA